MFGYVTAVDIRDPNQQNVGFIDEVKGAPIAGRGTKASTLILWLTKGYNEMTGIS
ncbi:MAG: hypothetical protein ACRD5E_02420 [Nitrososphaeraceae archaeon]